MNNIDRIFPGDPAASPPLQSLHWASDAPVLQARKLRSDSADIPRPVFGEDVWNLSAAIHRNNAISSLAVIDFRRYADPFRRMTAKELAMQRLNRPVAPLKAKTQVRPMSITSVKGALVHLDSLYAFMDTSGVLRLRDMSHDHLNSYLRHLVDGKVSKKYVAGKLAVPVWLYEARELLTFDWIDIPPWGTKSLNKVLGHKDTKENKTPRIPEAAMGPLLRWSMFYVDTASHDIVAAYKEKFDESRIAPKASHEEVRQRIIDYLDDLRRRGRGLPMRTVRETGVNFKRIAQIVGYRSHGHLVPYRDLIDAAEAEMGLDNGIDASITPVGEEGVPWREDFTLGRDIIQEGRRLITACYIVCCYLSGMRDSEVQAIRHGAYEPMLDVDGSVIRHKVRSTQYKGESSTGNERTWVVIEPVARAVAVMEELTSIVRKKVGTDFLFIHLENRVKANPSLTSDINRYIREFIKHVNVVVQPRLPSLDIPHIDLGAESDMSRISTRMFRRTVAWHIANQPFGVVAGMIQYGHMCETMFEGYAGSSASGFRSEVEAERDFARRFDILTMYEDAKRGVRPAGPMADELVAEFEHVRSELNDFPGKVIDERRREKMLEHLRTRLYPGLLADCFFEAKEAQCLRHVKEDDRREPVNGVCDPHCENACWANKHLAAWTHSLEDVTRLGRRNRISSIQRGILRAKADEYASIIKKIKEAGHVDQE